MSEDIELGTSHLCAAEDAFEHFQAVSMYEENEFITLADIVPPQPSVPDYGDLSQIPYDNEVILTTTDEPREVIIKDTTRETEHPINLDSIISHLDSSDNNDVGQSSENSIQPQQPKRRGRKKKNLDERTSLAVFDNDNSNTVENSSNNQDIMIEKSPNIQSKSLSAGSRPVRRGRPPKKLIDPDILTGLPETTPTKTSKPSLPPETGCENSTSGRKKRGRPRVNKGGRPKLSKVSNDQSLSVADSTTLLSSEKSGSENDKVDDNLSTKTTKRGRKANKVSAECINDSTEPVEESLTENNRSISNIDDQSMILSNKKSTGKRSKRTKVEQNLDIQEVEGTDFDTVVQSPENKVSNEPSNLENDDLDEISLSQLKNVADISTLLSPTIDNTENNLESISKNDDIVSDLAKKTPKKSGKKGRPKKGLEVSAQIPVKTVTNEEASVNDTEHGQEDETDDLCLSQLKDTIQTDTPTIENSTLVDDAKLNINDNETPATNTPLMSDFELNIDGIGNDTNKITINDPDQSLLVEDSSKRPVRRRVKQPLHYEQESDEDPFANLPSSSDDEPRKGRNRKGNRYQSDEEYYPGSKRGKLSTDTGSDSDIQRNLDDSRKQKRKVFRKKSESQSPRKRGKKAETSVTSEFSKDDDIEEVLQSSVITAGDDRSQSLKAWGSSNEFENFLAKKIQGTDLKIKKVSSAEPSDTNITPIEIPVINRDEKKRVEMCSQTVMVSTETTGVQTSTPFDIAMKENITLTKEQSEKACQFLNSIVKTTSELGLLMTQKSEDFIKKKIHTENVTDTFKMDYCVRKSFLLFKLAKHNLMQMEEDLANQYEHFLETNKLSYCRDKQKEVLAGKPKTNKKETSDSDCEIVDEIKPPKSNTTTKKPNTSKFNPKTVFLNKELSIKIAKKPSEPQKPQKKIDIKGRHTVWISDTVMVKKVKPTQSFLAQDSRNKKPPDTFVTVEMVSEFFTSYYRQRALTVCAPFTSTEWRNVSRECICNYFVVKPDNSNDSANFSTTESYNLINTANNTSSVSIPNTNTLNNVKSIAKAIPCPEPLFKLCFRVIKKHLHLLSHIKKEEHRNSSNNNRKDGREQPAQLLKLCINVLTPYLINEQDSKLICTRNMIDCIEPITVPTLKTLCYSRVVKEQDSKLTCNKNMTDCQALITVPTLKTLCYRRVVNEWDSKLICNKNMTDCKALITVPTLKTLCYGSVVDLVINSNATYQEIPAEETQLITCKSIVEESSITVPSSHENGLKSLFSLCVELIQDQQEYFNKECTQLLTPNSLKHIAFENIKYLLFKSSTIKNVSICQIGNEVPIGGLTINSVNTLSEEAFLNLEQPIDIPESSHFVDDDFDNDESDTYGDSNIEPDFNGPDEGVSEETNWVSQVQMQELRSFPFSTSEDVGHKKDAAVTEIKLEPLDEVLESIADPPVVKIEPCIGLDEMTLIPGIDPIKPEISEEVNPRAIERQNSSSYDVDAFESFVRSNKLMNSDEYNNEDIFSQSAARVRRQHEPDLDEDNDMGMSLLVPQTYEPIHIEHAKGSLMESSSDESSKNKKAVAKKKAEKKRGRPKKISKAVPPAPAKDKVTNEVAILTRRMRDKIRQEEKKDESSDSENENYSPILRNKKDNNETSKTSPSKNSVDTEIQCNNVDSTENGSEVLTERFTGFTAIDQNETSSYQKFMKYVYDKIVPNVDEVDEQPVVTNAPTENNTPDANIKVNSDSPIFNSNEPVELLECEPTMPILDELETKSTKKRKEKKAKPVEVNATDKEPFIERHGWKCYPVNKNDSKLYQTASIRLEKLPEHFVETYFRYRDVKKKNKDDAEVDRLTNLSTLKRNSTLKEPKTSGKYKRDKGDRSSEQNSELGSRGASPANSDHYNELTPSEDEGGDAEDEIPLVAPKQTENILAKDLLMNDSDSDGGTTIKQELTDEPLKNTRTSKIKSKVTPHKVENTDPESLMLTADKVMNKELNLLHAPVVLHEDVQDTSSKKHMTRSKQKSATKNQSMKGQNKSDEDSSSEEEKQWVNTKEKLLKRLGKKEDTSVDDAKRAKLVSEFIERRADYPDSHKRPRGRGTRSRKRFLERQKQLKVLSRELFGETSIDSFHNKRSAGAYFKGRRNIRKVIDKKSLARSTVIANMEEFERKRRINTRQTRLRELLGCEEGVNVLVINDEVCLEYDFEECRPVVTIHPFFTKVMKAHQYEGVKFMWDACFESLSVLQSGHAGGGCILAHCMGLGKTLQVLALLHTVLTHPQVGMRRVLVCCPLSTVLNWVDEIHKWLGPVTNAIKVFELSKLKKTYERAYQLEDWYNGGGIFIIGYELFRSLSTLDPLLDDIRPTIVNKIRMALLDPGPDIIVCDEGHLLKNDCSVLAVAMSRVATKRRIVLTGTPMQNNLREYYCMVDFVKPNLLGTYAEYSNRFENPIMNGQHRDSLEEDIKLMKARTHILHKVLEGCLQRQEASVLYPYLPKKHEYTVFIPLTQCQWNMYKHYLTYYSRQGKHGILKDFHILHKIWSHPQVLQNFHMKSAEDKMKKVDKLEDDLAAEDIEVVKPNETEQWWLPYIEGGKILDSLEASNKFMVVFQILKECIALGDKMLLFSTSLFCLDGLEYFLKKINKWSLGQEYFRLDGSVPAEVRQKWCREFNAEHNEKTKLFLVSTRAGSLGLNMTAANRVVILDTSWNPAHDIQSIFRVYRFGQKKDCYIYRLVAMGTMEQKIYERSVTKQAVACRVVDEQQIDRHYNSADLTELYKYDESGSGVACGVAVGVQDVALLRVARAVPLHAVHEHDSLLRGSEPALPEHERAAAWHQFQQEQEDRQVQNKLVYLPKIPLKRVYGHEYSKNPVLGPPNIKAEDTSDDYVPPGPKSRKDKKVVKCIVPVPGPSALQPVVHVPNILKYYTRQSAAKNTGTKSDANEPAVVPDTVDDFQRAGPSGTIPSVQIVGSKTAQRADDEDEEAMVQKISSILIKHNFQDKKMDIAALIAQVRRLVSKEEVGEMPDELSRSIADVLLGDGGRSQPSVSDIVCESLSTVVRRPAAELAAHDRLEKPKPKCKKGKVANSEPELNLSKTKRKARVAAEQTTDTPSHEVIDLADDDDDPADFHVEYMADIPYEYEVEITDQPTVSPKPPSVTKSEPKATPVVADVRNKVEIGTTKTKTKKVVEMDSILLSDDEATPVPETPKPTKPPKCEEIVPLPRSLLTNKNFIKIVAHTYSAGNPMLDNDAATLAAQYSTFKALQESEKTGKDIVSGPIYDIAVNVLGTMTLKKLLTVNDKVKKSAEDTAALQFKENLQAFETNTRSTCSVTQPSQVPERPLKPANKVQARKEVPIAPKIVPSNTQFFGSTAQVRTRYTTGGQKLVKLVESRTKPVTSTTTDTPSGAVAPVPNNVVPVGLFQRGASVLPSQQYAAPGGPAYGAAPRDECILPDHDGRAEPALLPPSAAPASASVPVPALQPIPALQLIPAFTRPANSEPVILNVSLNAPRRTAHLPRNAGAEPNRKSAVQVAKDEPKPSRDTAPPDAGPCGATICLDSDEDDAAAPGPRGAAAAAATPIAVTPAALAAALGGKLPLPPLTAALGGKLPLPPLTAALGGEPPPPPSLRAPRSDSKPSLLQNKLPGSAQRKFVLVPASQVPQDILKSIPEKAKVSDPRPQSVAQAAGGSTPAVKTKSKTDVKDTVVHASAANFKVTKTKCKPGDIFRISKTGQIEVINKDDLQVAGIATEADKTNAVAAAVLKPERAPSTEPQKAAEPTSRKRTVSSSSSSSRPSSPDDPLSILKDVVHIQAAVDTPKRAPVTAPKTIVTKHEKNRNTSLQHVISVSAKSKKTYPAPSNSTADKAIKIADTAKSTKSYSSPSNSTADKAIKIADTAKSKKTYPSPSNSTSDKAIKIADTAKSKKTYPPPYKSTTADKAIKNSDSNRTVFKIEMKSTGNVDKTNNKSLVRSDDAKATNSGVLNKSKTNKTIGTSALKVKTSTKTPEKGTPTKIVGNLKNMVLDGSGKGLTVNTQANTASIDLTGQNSVQVTNIKKIPALATVKSEAKKRPPAEASTSAAKKKKPMTLKDFDLDDLDDIIELD